MIERESVRLPRGGFVSVGVVREQETKGKNEGDDKGT
jgi:hypothetical protein